MNGAEQVVYQLEQLDVKHIFGYPGGAVLPLYDALYDNDSIKHIRLTHEQHVIHAADGYARASGKVGVAMVTSGPGATNTITGSPVARAGGGGASSVPGRGPGNGGTGGGGAGGNPGAGTAGTANTGGGGGGSGSSAAGATGGSGIVVIRYKFQ